MDSSPDAAIGGILAIMFTAALIALAVGVAIHVLICWLLSDAFKRLPPQYRQMEPGMVWLLLIPCFSVVWNFFVYTKLSRSYQAYFQSIGRTDVGTAQYEIGLAYCIAAACCIVPYVNCLAIIAAIILLIMYLVKITDLKNQIPQGQIPPTMMPPMGTPPTSV